MGRRSGHGREMTLLHGEGSSARVTQRYLHQRLPLVRAAPAMLQKDEQPTLDRHPEDAGQVLSDIIVLFM
jgi:hypothetical protein